jgi:hypothetical protein
MTPTSEADWSPQRALASIEAVTKREASLRGRTEGLTWTLWGLALAGGQVTDAVLGPEPGPAGAFAGLWTLVAILASIGLWRSGAIDLNPRVSTRRAVVFFVGWQVLLLLASIPVYVALYVLGLGRAPPAGALLSLGALLLAFGAWNPLAFTPRGRVAGFALGIISIAAGVAGLALHTGDAYNAVVIGGSWATIGLYLLYRS